MPPPSPVPSAVVRPHQAVLRQRRHRLDDRRPRGPVVVEEVAAEQHDVGPVLRRELEDLVKGREGVVLADLVLLPGAEVVVGGDEDAEDVVVVVVVVGVGRGGDAVFFLGGGLFFCFLSEVRRSRG